MKSIQHITSGLLVLWTFQLIAQTPESAGVLEFGDDQTLFIGDSYGGYIYAYTMNEPRQDDLISYNVRELDSKIANALGADRGDIMITDLTVNPISKNAFVAVHKIVDEKYVPVVLRVTPEGAITNFDLSKNKKQRFAVDDTPSNELVFWQRIDARSLTFSDLEYHDGKLYVAGLSNADFDASLRVIEYPFQKGGQSTTTVEIYHTVHNQQETRSPIQTLEIVKLDGRDYVLAAYTCTPLVLFPLEDIQDGKHLVGQVIAELGYGNAPIDIKHFSAQNAEGQVEEVALVINKSRGPALLRMEDILESSKEPGITSPAGFSTAGTPFFQPAMGGTYQLEDLDGGHLLTLRRNTETGETEMLSFMKGFYFRLTDFVSDYIYPDYVYGEEGELWRPIQNILKIDEGHPEAVVDK